MSLKAVSDATFKEDVIESSKPILVDFWAPWCGPCRMITPVLEEIHNEMGANISIVKVNIDDNPLTPTEYNIRSIPTLILFKDGKVKDTKMGGAPKSSLIEWIQQHI